MDFQDLNPDQRREVINTTQRFQAWREALTRQRANRGSMVWSRTKGHEYLMRVGYDKRGRRRQTSLGPRNRETELIKANFERARVDAADRLEALKPVMLRQAGINRALGLGRVPLISAKIIRALDAGGLLGEGIRILGTNAIYAYEAAAGVHTDAGLTTTEDVDLLLDSHARLAFAVNEDMEQTSLLHLLQRVDKSFARAPQTFRAVNKDGYIVDLIKPLRDPSWMQEPGAGGDAIDPIAVVIEGLSWHESAPPFEAIAIDERGEPLRMVTSDPRVFAAHKLWVSKRLDPEPISRRRDRDQARAVAVLTARHFPHLPYEQDALRMLPKAVFEDARALFAAPEPYFSASAPLAR